LTSPTRKFLELDGKILAPGFVDCHTHLVFGGTRAQEYAARLTRSAQEVAALGIPAGIQATVTMTRGSTAQVLEKSAMQRLGQMLRHGTTTVESKSGYGLNVENELQLLQVNRRLQQSQPLDIVSTFLGAHDFPPETPSPALPGYPGAGDDPLGGRSQPGGILRCVLR
jgi:imidazolonepropionase